MAVQCKVETFAKATGAAPTATNVRTGYGFQPVACLLFCGKLNAAGFSNNAVMAVGFSDGSTEFAIAAVSRDGQAPSDEFRRHTNEKGLTILNASGTLVAECDVTFQSDGLTLTWTTNEAVDDLVTVIAFGGDVTNAKVVEFTANTAGGTQAITGAGFAPDAAIFLSAAINTDPPGTLSSGDSQIAIGGQGRASPHLGVSMAFGSEDNVTPPDTATFGVSDGISNQYLYNNKGILASGGASYISTWGADGVTLTWPVTPTQSWRGAVLFLKGGLWASKYEQTRTTTGSQRYHPNPPVNAKGAILFGSGPGAGECSAFVGAADGSAEGAVWFGANHAANPTETDRASSTTKGMFIATNASPASATYDGDVSLWEGGIDIDWTTSGGQAFQWGFLVVGEESVITKRRQPQQADILRRPRGVPLEAYDLGAEPPAAPAAPTFIPTQQPGPREPIEVVGY